MKTQIKGNGIDFSEIEEFSKNITKAINSIEEPMSRQENPDLQQMESQKNTYDERYLNIILQKYEGDDKVKKEDIEKLQSFVDMVSESRVVNEQGDLGRVLSILALSYIPKEACNTF